MYGLPQSGKLAYDKLAKLLTSHNFHTHLSTPGLWTHTTRPIAFILCVDDFGLKYTHQADAIAFIAMLQTLYPITIDWSGQHYCGLTIAWHYAHPRHVDITMPTYIPSMLHRRQHRPPPKPQHSPYHFTQPQYFPRIQSPTPQDTTPKLPPHQKTFIQQTIGTLLYYAREVDPTILVTLSSLASQQSSPTQTTLQRIKHLLDYIHTHPQATLRYYSSPMTLSVDSDASYLSETKCEKPSRWTLLLSSHINHSHTTMPHPHRIHHSPTCARLSS